MGFVWIIKFTDTKKGNVQVCLAVYISGRCSDQSFILPFCACSRGFSAGHLFLFPRSQKRTGKEKKKTAGAGISGRDAVCFYRPDGGIFG